jgi:hypothetical protein
MKLAALAIALITPCAIHAQGAPTREYTITVRPTLTANNSYRIVVHDSAGAPTAQIVKLVAPNQKQVKLATLNGGEFADTVIARLYTLDVWQLASKEADDGACRTGADGRKVCDTVDDGTDVEIVISTKGETRTRTYHAPSASKTDAAKRAQRLIDFVLELGEMFDG